MKKIFLFCAAVAASATVAQLAGGAPATAQMSSGRYVPVAYENGTVIILDSHSGSIYRCSATVQTYGVTRCTLTSTMN